MPNRRCWNVCSVFLHNFGGSKFIHLLQNPLHASHNRLCAGSWLPRFVPVLQALSLNPWEYAVPCSWCAGLAICSGSTSMLTFIANTMKGEGFKLQATGYRKVTVDSLLDPSCTYHTMLLICTCTCTDMWLQCEYKVHSHNFQAVQHAQYVIYS